MRNGANLRRALVSNCVRVFTIYVDASDGRMVQKFNRMTALNIDVSAKACLNFVQPKQIRQPMDVGWRAIQDTEMNLFSPILRKNGDATAQPSSRLPTRHGIR